MGLQRVGHDWATEQQQFFIHNVSTLGCYMETIAVTGHGVGFQGCEGNDSGKTVPSASTSTRLSSHLHRYPGTLGPSSQGLAPRCYPHPLVRSCLHVDFVGERTLECELFSTEVRVILSHQRSSSCVAKTNMALNVKIRQVRHGSVWVLLHTHRHTPMQVVWKNTISFPRFLSICKGFKSLWLQGWDGKRGCGHGGGPSRDPGGDGTWYLDGGGACTNLHVWKNYTHTHTEECR